MKRFALPTIILATIILIGVGLSIGPAHFSIFGYFQLSEAQKNILLNIRLPRILFAIAIGIILSVSGHIYQALLHNDLADPYLLGVATGASFGAVVSFVIGLPSFVWFFAFVGALGAFGFVLLLSKFRSENTISNLSIILGGVVVNSMLSALMLILMMLSQKDVQQILYWLMGNISFFSLNQAITVLSVAGIYAVLARLVAYRVNVLSLGYEESVSTGLDYTEQKRLLLFFATVFLAIGVSYTGPVAFVGLIVPHMAKLIVGSDMRKTWPFLLALGAFVMVLSDIFARVILSPAELPVGAITALVGGPFFFYILIRGRVER